MKDLPDLSLMQSFAVVAQELNFRRSAEHLGIDQSALSRRIQKLEATLGYALFERTTREVMLTQAGLTLQDAMSQLISGYSRAVTEARRVADGRTGRLRVGYMAFAATELMPKAVAEYSARHPEVAMELTYMRTQGQKLALAEDEIDIGFMIGPYENSGFHTEELSNDLLCVIMPKGHRLLSQPRIGPEDLRAEPLVLGDNSEWGEYRYRLGNLFSQVGVSMDPSIEASNTLAFVGLVAAGFGITILPENLIGFLGDRVEARPISNEAFRISTVIAWKRGNRARSLLNFVDVVKRQRKSRACCV